MHTKSTVNELYYHSSLIRTTDELKKTENQPCIIFGAGVVGEVLYREVTTHGVVVECFCDNNQTKCDKVLEGIPVFTFNEILARYSSAHFIISIADTQDVLEQLKQHHFDNITLGGFLLHNMLCSLENYSAPIEFVRFAIEACISSHEAFVNVNKIFLRSVDIVITERCSLKCQDCSNLMQYYTKPENREMDEILNSIDHLCTSVDLINEFRIIGGEPFMNKNIYTVIDRLCTERKVNRVAIFTNASIPPKKEYAQILAHKKLIYIITDYGDLVKNTSKFIAYLEKIGAAYYSQPPKNWTSCASITKHNRSIEKQKDVFKRCCAKYLYTSLGGKLFRCPFAAHVDALGAAEDFKDDYVVLVSNGAEQPTLQDIKQQMRTLMYNKQYLDVCDYCSGRFLDDAKIEPAIQVSQPIEYMRYR